jgi:hypothetical protein
VRCAPDAARARTLLGLDPDAPEAAAPPDLLLLDATDPAAEAPALAREAHALGRAHTVALLTCGELRPEAARTQGLDFARLVAKPATPGRWPGP